MPHTLCTNLSTQTKKVSGPEFLVPRNLWKSKKKKLTKKPQNKEYQLSLKVKPLGIRSSTTRTNIVKMIIEFKPQTVLIIVNVYIPWFVLNIFDIYTVISATFFTRLEPCNIYGFLRANQVHTASDHSLFW